MNGRKRSVLPSTKLAIEGIQDELWFKKNYIKTIQLIYHILVDLCYRTSKL